MREIKTEYEKIIQARDADEFDGVDFFSNAYRKTREWLVLGATQRLLIHAGLEAPTFAREDEAPDFQTFLEDRSPLAPLEVTEALLPGYRRHRFYKNAAKPGASPYHGVPLPVTEAPWEPIRAAISAKANKYPKATWLLVYHGISRLEFPNWRTPFHDQLLAEQALRPFAEVATFKRVLVLSSDMGCLVELHPLAEALAPDLRE